MTALIQMTNEWLSLLHTLLRKSFLFSPLTEIRYEMPLSDFIFEEKIAGKLDDRLYVYLLSRRFFSQLSKLFKRFLES